MRTTLYMATTANGYIAREDGSVDWAAEENWQDYFQTIKKKGNLIIGRNTYEIMPPEEFIQDCLYIVMTKEKNLSKKTEKLIFTDFSPQEVLWLLENQGYEEAVVGGGSKIDSAFLEAGLIDEVILNVEPIILGKGIPLFSQKDFTVDLALIKAKKLTENLLQLQYMVMK